MNSTLFREPAYLNGVPPESAQYGMPCFVTSSDAVPMYLHREWLESRHDGEAGTVDGPGGHFYRVGEHIVTTDSLGHMALFTYATWMDADVCMLGIARQIIALTGDTCD